MSRVIGDRALVVGEAWRGCWPHECSPTPTISAPHRRLLGTPVPIDEGLAGSSAT